MKAADQHKWTKVNQSSRTEYNVNQMEQQVLKKDITAKAADQHELINWINVYSLLAKNKNDN